MVKKINDIKKPTKQGEAIQFMMSRGFKNKEITKALKIPKSTVSYYRKRPNDFKKKRCSQNYQKNI